MFGLKMVFLGILLSHALTLFAQGKQVDTTLFLQEVVVTGSRGARPITRTPGSVQVLTPLVLRNSPGQSVDEFLTMVSGINTTRSDGISDMHSQVSIRGLSGNEQGRTLVLLDGIPINTSDDGSVNWNSIHVDHVQRIEVCKGPGSSLYGNHALGGVIHIISRKPTVPLALHVSGSCGSLGTWKGSVGLSGYLKDRWAWWISGYYQRSDGFNNVPVHLRTEPDYSVARFVKEGGVYAKLSFAPTPLFQTEFSADVYRDQRGEGEKILAANGEYRRFDHERFQTRFYGEQGLFSYQLAVYFQRQHYFKLDERLNAEEYQRFDVKSHRDDWGAILQLRLSGRNHDFAVGGEFKNGHVDGGDYYVTSPDRVLNRGTMTLASLFVQEELDFWQERLWLQLALRYDHAFFHDGWFEAAGEQVTDFYGYNGRLKHHRWDHFSPRVAFRFNPFSALSMYFSYSQGFRASILDDLCRSGWMWVGPKIANPALGPERLKHYEAGGTWRIVSGLSLSSSLYTARGEDFLYYVATGEKMWGKRDIFRRENVSRVEMKGLEAELDCVLATGLKFHLNYAYSSSRIKDFEKKPELNGKRLTYAPKEQWKGYLLWTGKGASAMVRGLYKSKQYTAEDNSTFIAGFSVWDVQLSKWFFRHRLNVGAEVLNVFDCRYMNTRDYISAGRLIRLKLALNLTIS